jgi:16S rRNA (guanine(966)-N(2))-methyltransferase RsmD
MRIIAGTYKGREIVSIAGNSTRPTTSFNRELIFSTLFDVEEMSVLDLFAGSGALAFEAISRGAKEACLVDMSEKAVKAILHNAQKLDCKDKIQLQKMKVELYLKKTERRFDLILVDPPYSKNCVNPILNLIFERNLLNDEGMIVMEHSIEEKINEEFKPFINKQKRNGKTVITFFEKL